MKILIAMPVVTGAEHTKEAIESIVCQSEVDLLICDNGAVQEVKNLLNKYRNVPNVLIWENKRNMYVNPAWNSFMAYFLKQKDKYSHLIIVNSDIIMQDDWFEVVKNRWSVSPDEILVPVQTRDKGVTKIPVDTKVSECKVIKSSIAGIFITLNIRQAEKVYPIPDNIKVWFGDTWIYSILCHFYNVLIPKNLIVYHVHSQTIQKIDWIGNVIEKDKIAWRKLVTIACQRRIEYEQNRYNKYLNKEN